MSSRKCYVLIDGKLKYCLLEMQLEQPFPTPYEKFGAHSNSLPDYQFLIVDGVNNHFRLVPSKS
jgi:hypothetical protein